MKTIQNWTMLLFFVSIWLPSLIILYLIEMNFSLFIFVAITYIVLTIHNFMLDVVADRIFGINFSIYTFMCSPYKKYFMYISRIYRHIKSLDGRLICSVMES